MPKYTFDTSFIISNKLSDIPDNFLLSEVVLLELIGNAQDDSVFKTFQALRKSYEADGLLIVPNSEDWLMTSKIIYWLEQGKKKNNKGNAPAKRPGATQRMALDVLIAVSARRYGVTVITENWDDFNSINYYCKFKLLRGTEFLKKTSKVKAG